MTPTSNHILSVIRISAAVLFSISACAVSAAEVNVYTARKDHLIKPILDKFTQQTGIKVNLLSAGEDQLIERLKSEGNNSSADIFQTTTWLVSTGHGSMGCCSQYRHRFLKRTSPQSTETPRAIGSASRLVRE